LRANWPEEEQGERNQCEVPRPCLPAGRHSRGFPARDVMHIVPPVVGSSRLDPAYPVWAVRARSGHDVDRSVGSVTVTEVPLPRALSISIVP
jgi:hypothetical protein